MPAASFPLKRSLFADMSGIHIRKYIPPSFVRSFDRRAGGWW